VGGSYDFRVVRLYGAYRTREGDAASLDEANYWLGVAVPIGSLTLQATVGRVDNKTAADRDAKGYSFGAEYLLSKRTDLYMRYAKLRNENGASFGLDNGINGPFAFLSGGRRAPPLLNAPRSVLKPNSSSMTGDESGALTSGPVAEVQQVVQPRHLVTVRGHLASIGQLEKLALFQVCRAAIAVFLRHLAVLEQMQRRAVRELQRLPQFARKLVSSKRRGRCAHDGQGEGQSRDGSLHGRSFRVLARA